MLYAGHYIQSSLCILVSHLHKNPIRYVFLLFPLFYEDIEKEGAKPRPTWFSRAGDHDHFGCLCKQRVSLTLHALYFPPELEIMATLGVFVSRELAVTLHALLLCKVSVIIMARMEICPISFLFSILMSFIAFITGLHSSLWSHLKVNWWLIHFIWLEQEPFKS